MEGGCRALYLGPDLPPELRGLRSVTWIPAVTISPIDANIALAAELIRSHRYECVAFTSPRGPSLLHGYLEAWPVSVKALCVGHGTARAFTNAFGVPCLFPSEYTTASLAKLALSERCTSILTLRSEEGDEELENTVSRVMRVRRIDIYAEKPREFSVEGRFTVIIASSSFIAEVVCPKVRGSVELVIAMGPKAERAVKALCPDVEVITSHEHSFKAVGELLAAVGCG
ncbi:MAG: uroporphyrinogen-III synthase [Acidilobus sp.]